MILLLSFSDFDLQWTKKSSVCLETNFQGITCSSCHIFTIAQKPKSDKTKLCIQVYVTALMNIWTNSFGVEHILTRGCVTKRDEKLVTNYYNNVYSESYRKQPKKKRLAFVKKSIR